MDIKVGSKIAGAEIISLGYEVTSTKQRRLFVGFHCSACGAQAKTLATVATKALNGKSLLRCISCQDAKRYTEAKKPKAKEPKPALSDTVALDGGKLQAKTMDALNALAPTVKAAAMQIVQEHVAACRKLGVRIEYFDRVVIEAIEDAQMGARNPKPLAQSPTLGPFRCYKVVYGTPKDVSL